MLIKLYSKFLTPIPLRNKLPHNDHHRILPNARPWFAEEDGNEFFLQELKGNECTVRLNSFRINRPTSFTLTSDCTIRFQISPFGTTQFELAGYGTVILHQRQYNIITVPFSSAQYNVSDPALLLPINICLSRDFLEPFRQDYQKIDELLKRADQGKPAAMFDVNQMASTEILAIIDLIIEHEKYASDQPDLLDAYVAELLRHVLVSRQKTKKIKLSQDEINNIYEAAELLLEIEKPQNSSSLKESPGQKSTNNSEDEDLTDSGWTFRNLAELADMSLYSFTKAFKEVFGQSLTNYRKEFTWQTVLVLLLRGEENLKTISYMAGYNDQPSFSRAFKKRFRCTPREFVQDFTKKIENYKKTAKRNRG